MLIPPDGRFSTLSRPLRHAEPVIEKDISGRSRCRGSKCYRRHTPESSEAQPRVTREQTETRLKSRITTPLAVSE